MKAFRRIFPGVILMTALLAAGVNLYLRLAAERTEGRPYRVEISRIVEEIDQKGWAEPDLSDYQYVTGVTLYSSEKEAIAAAGDSDYVIRWAGGRPCRIEYRVVPENGYGKASAAVNIALGVMALMILGILIFIQEKILKPFEMLRDVPYELARGNLTVPIKESKNRYFGKFVWGVDVLRENMEQQKRRELELQREKKTLVLSISHDIKTPLSAVKLYAKALARGLYPDEHKQKEIAESICAKADEIEGFVSQIVKASSEDFLNLEVEKGEFYLSALVSSVVQYYKEKMELARISFSTGHYSDCMLKGDPDRSVEVLQNLMENAIKYGDGHNVCITFSEEENCLLVTVKNSGSSLAGNELPHIFDVFWRGSNAGSIQGSGLGLHICRQLMQKMGGEIFADLQGDAMCVTAVFCKAG